MILKKNKTTNKQTDSVLSSELNENRALFVNRVPPLGSPITKSNTRARVFRRRARPIWLSFKPEVCFPFGICTLFTQIHKKKKKKLMSFQWRQI